MQRPADAVDEPVTSSSREVGGCHVTYPTNGPACAGPDRGRVLARRGSPRGRNRDTRPDGKREGPVPQGTGPSRFLPPLAPVLGGEGPGVRGLWFRYRAPSPPTPRPRTRGRGE